MLPAALIASYLAFPGAPCPHAEPVAPDSPRWLLEGAASVTDYLGRRSIRLDGGGATLKDLALRDGVIDVDVATPASRGFFGIQFRISADGNNGEWVYLRQHKSGLPDALQYTPVLATGLNWQIYNGPGFTGSMEIPRGAWFHLRLELTGAQARLYADDMRTPVLVMPDLKSGIEKGQIALAVLQGETYFSNFTVRETPPVAWERRPPPMPAGTLTQWRLSPSFDALTRDLERPLPASETKRCGGRRWRPKRPGSW